MPYKPNWPQMVWEMPGGACCRSRFPLSPRGPPDPSGPRASVGLRGWSGYLVSHRDAGRATCRLRTCAIDCFDDMAMACSAHASGSPHFFFTQDRCCPADRLPSATGINLVLLHRVIEEHIINPRILNPA